MLASYSQETGIRQAAVDTFSGEKPCGLCKRISAAEAKQEDKPQEPAPRRLSPRELMPEMLPLEIVRLESREARPLADTGFFTLAGSSGRGADAPPVPPPCV